MPSIRCSLIWLRVISMYNPEPAAKSELINHRARTITLGKETFDLIMCYICPLCKEPIIAYWKLGDSKPITADVVGRALRDSGFGGYLFYETANGQGFEYDHEKDPRKRHGHEKVEHHDYSEDSVLELWYPAIELNPIFSINDLFARCLDPHGDTYEKTHSFVADQKLALELIEAMRKFGDSFTVVDDLMKHGKPLFYFNLVNWNQLTKTSYYDTPEAGYKKRVEALTKWFGTLMQRVKWQKPTIKEDEEGG